MDFGLGIGYNPESSSSSVAAPNRSTAVNSLRTGIMAQFKNSFVPASSNSHNQFVSNSAGVQANKRTVLSGFVSGGTIGGEMHAPKINSTTAPASASTPTQSSRETAKETHTERSPTIAEFLLFYFADLTVIYIYIYIYMYMTVKSAK